MVLIAGFTEVRAASRSARARTTTKCNYDVIFNEDGGQVLELATTGSGDRANTGRRSQTVQFDKSAAITLLGLMEEVFGDQIHAPLLRPPGTVDGPASTNEHQASLPVELNWPTGGVSIKMPPWAGGTLQAGQTLEPQYDEQADGEMVGRDKGPQSRPTRAVAKAIEISAVSHVTSILKRDGWTLVRDCQADGVGYDFEFAKDGQRRKVEIKGIRGDQLEFNVTPLEYFVARNDPEFVLVAVTGALDERKRRVHVVSREELVGSPRRAIGYRIKPPSHRGQ
ncbi:protein NO VEIN domain-containing protein [Isoptericola sp. NPDC056605]|uniref:protein NO VEIN domain-containing protein n=1 Tax=Isoptericola sp. NPDC056605 TaxID=3345876 RepID=UPI0036A89846